MEKLLFASLVGGALTVAGGVLILVDFHSKAAAMEKVGFHEQGRTWRQLQNNIGQGAIVCGLCMLAFYVALRTGVFPAETVEPFRNVLSWASFFPPVVLGVIGIRANLFRK